MKFGVIQCITCGKAFGIALRFKTTTCPYCYKILKIKQNTIKFQSNSEADLTDIIGDINNKVLTAAAGTKPDESLRFVNAASGQTEVSRPAVATPDQKPDRDPDNIEQLVLRYKDQKESLPVIQKLVEDLGQIMDEFSIDDLESLLRYCSFNYDKVEEYIEQLKNLNVIYEPRAGRYKLLDD